MLTFLFSNRLQSFLNDGKINANGYLQFYELNTTTPKAVYADINGEALKPNPVPLDSAGTAEVYLKGSYTIYSFDRNNIQINEPIDVLGGINDYITSGGSGGFADNLILSVNTYNDVRAITNPYSVIFVQGREANADGGEGFFYFDASSTLSDDDGICISPATSYGRYIRLNVNNINPSWFGLAYNSSLDQSTFLSKAEFAASRYSKPVEITESVYINSDYTTSDTQFIFQDASKLVSTLSVEFTFSSAASISYIGRRIFGNSVQPIFQRGSTDYIRFSWMAADNFDGCWQKFISASTSETTYILDEDVDLASDIIIPNNSELVFENSSRIILTSGAPRNISIPKLNDAELITSAVYFPTSATVGTIDLKYANITPKFFCGVGSTVTSATSSQDYIALHASFKSGNIFLDDNYIIDTKHTINNNLTINSNIPQSISAIDVSAYNGLTITTSGNMISATKDIVFNNVGIKLTPFSSIHAAKATYTNCVVYCPSATGYLISDGWQDFNNCRLGKYVQVDESDNNVTFVNVIKESEPSKRFYKNNTQFQNVYLENEIKNTDYDNVLIADDDGYVHGTTNLNLGNFTAQNFQVLQTSAVNYNYGARKRVTTATYTVQASDPSVIACDTMGLNAQITITLPAAAATNKNMILIVNEAGYSIYQVNVQPPPGETFWGDGFSPYHIPQSLVVQRMTAWFIFVDGKWAMA